MFNFLGGLSAHVHVVSFSILLAHSAFTTLLFPLHSSVGTHLHFVYKYRTSYAWISLLLKSLELASDLGRFIYNSLLGSCCTSSSPYPERQRKSCEIRVTLLE